MLGLGRSYGRGQAAMHQYLAPRAVQLHLPFLSVMYPSKLLFPGLMEDAVCPGCSFIADTTQTAWRAVGVRQSSFRYHDGPCICKLARARAKPQSIPHGKDPERGKLYFHHGQNDMVTAACQPSVNVSSSAESHTVCHSQMRNVGSLGLPLSA